jgi:uncharacterized protein (TIGR00725 family)
MTQRVPYIGVVGTGEADERHERAAETIGAELARAGAVVVCGGLGGVMAAACRGAREAGGVTLGLLPGSDRDAANPWVSLAVPTGMGELRNGLIVRAADALVAVGGGFGTLSEIALALKLGRSVVGVGTWDIGSGVVSIDDPIAAARKALQLVTNSSPI